MEVKHNPVIGFSIVDNDRRIIGPPGTTIDPVFYSKERALAAAERYGRKEDVSETVEEYLEGIFNVVIAIYSLIHAATGIAPSARGLRSESGSTRALKIFCRSPIIMSSSPCPTFSTRWSVTIGS